MLVEGGEVPSNASPDSYSGYVRYFRDAITWVQRNNVEVVFGTLRDRTPLHPVMEELGCDTFALGCRSVSTYPKGAIDLARMVRERDISLLHCHESICGSLGGVAGRLTGRPVIFHRHHAQIGRPTRIFSLTASKLATHVIAVSAHAAKFALLHDRIPERKLTVAHNGIEGPPPFNPNDEKDFRRILSIPDDAVVLFSLGHLRPEKNFELILHSLPKIISKSDQEVHYVSVGTGPTASSLRALAASQNLTTVHFCGHQADIWPWLRLADIVVIPSLKESFGLVAVEAMAAARPVIVARTEGLVEVIEAGKSGVLFESGDGPSLTMAISQLIDDEAARSRLGRGGRQRYLEMFTSEAMAERWLAVYDKVSRPPGRIRPES